MIFAKIILALARRAKIHQRGNTILCDGRDGKMQRWKACRSGEPRQKRRYSRPDRMRASAETANREECREIEETGKPWRMVGARREDKRAVLREVILEGS